MSTATASNGGAMIPAGAFYVDHAPTAGAGIMGRAILDTIPSWFGVPEANDAFVEFVDTHDTWIARSEEQEPIGLISGQLHFPETAEIEIMAVRLEWHRRGVGRALVHAFEAHHRSLGTRLVEVKTLGPSHPDEGYRATREFYISLGFIAVEELWICGSGGPTTRADPLQAGHAAAGTNEVLAGAAPTRRSPSRRSGRGQLFSGLAT